eukprot:TRINITY_DN296_c0_g1_i2.p1 TRINITY_DN296_c0_g1~~TRINITY_DN296_c0_g1_i2.p1  ORF type:complete len:1146 (-),score=231.79 TRINITY_DN296_c0_g1_i2:150-3587(-)
MFKLLPVILFSCTTVFGCNEEEFMCAISHECISKAFKCDGIKNCPFGEDELNCSPTDCLDSEFRCKEDGVCIDRAFYCDGFYDCNDGSDEAEEYCKFQDTKKIHSCQEGHFMCNDYVCLPDSMRCDGTPECLGGEDELGCDLDEMTFELEDGRKVQADAACPPPMVRCKDEQQTCIPDWHFCDGSPDCLDGSDEVGCGNKTAHHQCLASEGKFACALKNSYEVDIMCIDADQLCNGSPQCPKGDDEENCGLKNCESFGCEQNCMESPHSGPQCYCEDGYELAIDGKNCQDIDECQQYGKCSQLCHNEKGKYACSCRDGYTVEGNSCKYSGMAHLFIALEGDNYNKGEIRSYNLATKQYIKAVDNVDKPVGVAFDYHTNQIIWSNSVDGQSTIERGEVAQHGKVTNHTSLLQTGLEYPEDLALHEPSGLFYFTDSSKAEIGVCSVVTDACAVISEEHDQPRGLAIHQADNLLFVTEWGSQPRIVRMQLDGRGRSNLITRDLVWPNGVFVDESTNRIFWTDAGLNVIESATIDGGDRRLVIREIYHPFSLVVFEDRVYWSDWEAYTIFSANKFTGNDLKVFASEHSRINGLSLQISLPELHSNPCKTMGCSHICIPTGVESAVCKCPDDMHLGFDDVKCVPNKDENSLILGVGNNILSLKPQHLGKVSLHAVAFEASLVTGLSSNAVAADLIALTNTSDLYHINVHTHASNHLSGEADITSLCYDSDSLNLFWINKVDKAVYMMSQLTKQIKTIAVTEEPKALSLLDDYTSIGLVDGTNLLQLSLDSHHTQILTNQVPALIQVMLYDKNEDTMYLADAESIYRYYLGEEAPHVLVEGVKEVVSMAVQDGYLYWSQAGSNYVSWTNVKRESSNQTVYKLAIDNPSKHNIYLSSMLMTDVYEKPCMFAGCTDLCIHLNAASVQCLCGDGRTMVRDNKFSNCKADEIQERGASSKVEHNSSSMVTFVGMIVSVCLVSVAVVVVVIVFCCYRKNKTFKTAEFINRSFGLSPSLQKGRRNEPGSEMSPVVYSTSGTLTEIENPGFHSIHIGNKSEPFAQDLEEEQGSGVFSRIYNKIKSYRDPQMDNLDTTGVVYESLSEAKGSSTPSMARKMLNQGRMETIKEGDSAYTDMSASMDGSEASFDSGKFLYVN